MTSTADQPEIRRPDFLVFSDDWGEHPSSCQHIFRHIAKDHRVLWVNTIGMRNPTLSWADARKVAVKVSKMLSRTREPKTAEKCPNITVCQPFMLPGGRSRSVRAFNARSVTKKVRTLLNVLDMTNPVIVTTVPNASEYPELLEGRKVIYYCVDDFSLWPGLDSERVRNMECRLVERCRAVVAVSDALAAKFKDCGKPISVLPHGVDLDHFGVAPNSEHPSLRDIREPRAGFFGLIDGRFDGTLVKELATRMPDVSFVFAGPTDSSVGKLPGAENLHFVGAIRYAELPSFIAGMRALILPYKVGALAKMLSPLKLKEYLATQKPIVSSAIEATQNWVGALSVARSPAEWEAVLRGIIALEFGARTTAIGNQLVSHSWSARADELLALCECGE